MKSLSDENSSCVISLVAFIPNFFVNLYHILNTLGYETPIIDTKNIIEFTLFIAFTSTTFIPFSSIKKFNETCISYAKEKVLPYKIITIFLFTYSVITMFLFKNIEITISALIMAHSFFIITYFKKLGFAKRYSDDYKIRWQKKSSGVNEDSKDPNIFWYYKVWFSPIVTIPKNLRPLPNKIIIFLAFVIISVTNKSLIVILLISCYFLLLFIEYFFSLYVETYGFCTKVRYYRNRGSDCWEITIIDYKHKRKIVFDSPEPPHFNTGDYVRVIIGMFSRELATCSLSIRNTY